MRRLGIIAAAAALAVAAAVLPARAASCCGGANGADLFTLPKFQRGLAGAAVQTDAAFDLRGAAGERLGARGWRAAETKLHLGGAYRLANDWQAGAGVPLVFKEVRAGAAVERGAGVGDAAAQLRYEIVDEDTCLLAPVDEITWHELAPSVHAALRAGLPTGRPTGRSENPLGADVTGRGLATVDAGLDVTKQWGRLGNSLSLAGGWQSAYAGDDARLAAGPRWSAGAGVIVFLSYKHSLTARIEHRRERPGGLRATATSLGWSKILDDGWWLRATLSESALVEGRNTPVSLGGTVQASRLF